MAKDETISREEFENLKNLVLNMKDLLSKCNLKIDADFDDLELNDDLYPEFEDIDDVESVKDIEVKDNDRGF